MRTVFAKQGSPVSVVNSLLSSHLPISSPLLLLYLLIGKLPLPALFLSWFHISAAFAVCIQHSHFLYLPYMPLSPLLIHNTPPQLCFPRAPTRLAIIAEENSLDLKISMSVSVLLPWRVPQGCAALWMALSVRLVWGSIHTHHRTTHTHFLKDTQKQLLLLFCGFVITVILHQANVASAPSCGFTAVRVKRTNPAAIKCLLLLPRSLLWTDHSGTIYFIYHLKGNTLQGTPGSARTKTLQQQSTRENLPYST